MAVEMMPSAPGSPHVTIDIRALEASLRRQRSNSSGMDAPVLKAARWGPGRDKLQPASAVLLLSKPFRATMIGADLKTGAEKSLMRVEEVEPHSIAEASGLVAQDDLVLTAGGVQLRSAQDVLEVVGGCSGTFCLQTLGGKTISITKEVESTAIGLTVCPVAPVVVSRVGAGGLAERAGLREGDEVLSINHQFAHSAADVATLIAESAGEIEIEVRLPRPPPALSPLPRPRLLTPNGQRRRISAGPPGAPSPR